MISLDDDKLHNDTSLTSKRFPKIHLHPEIPWHSELCVCLSTNDQKKAR